MRVVLVVNTFPNVSQTFIVTKFLGLLERGVDVHVVCSRRARSSTLGFPELSARKDLRQRIHTIPSRHDPWGGGLRLARCLIDGALSNPRVAARYATTQWRRFGPKLLRHLPLDSWFLSLRPDVIHFEFGPRALGHVHVGEVLGSRTIVSFRGYDLNFYGLDKPALYDEVWQRADAVHCLGEELFRRATQRGCPPDKPHALIPPAVDVGFFAPGPRAVEVAGTPRRPLRVVSVARLHWKKGYDYALEALGRLREAGLVFDYRIIGDGPDRDAVVACARDFGLADAVQLLGPRSRSDVRDELQWADVFVHPAVSEGFCNAVMEAQSMALPVVCTDADGLAENVVPGVTGLVVPRRDAQALAEKISLLAGDPATRVGMGREGRAHVTRAFAPQEQIAAFMRLYDSVVRAG